MRPALVSCGTENVSDNEERALDETSLARLRLGAYGKFRMTGRGWRKVLSEEIRAGGAARMGRPAGVTWACKIPRSALASTHAAPRLPAV